MNPSDRFDKMVAKMKTVDLTRNTIKITKLPDDFEPMNDDGAEKISKIIP